MGISRSTAIILATVLVAACKHPIEIVGEGDVWSTQGRTCSLEDFIAGLPNCTENEVTGAYSDTYFAEPRTGWVFDRWEIYCKNAAINSCDFNIGASWVAQFAGATMPPLRAVFRPEGTTPITATVEADKRTWAQPDDFTGLTWNQLQTACPGGTCAATVVLNGYSLAGWHWAKVADVNALLNTYIGSDELGPGPDSHTALDAPWATNFFLDGWDPTFAHTSGAAVLTAITADLKDATTAYVMEVQALPAGNNDIASSAEEVPVSAASSLSGAVFYR